MDTKVIQSGNACPRVRVVQRGGRFVVQKRRGNPTLYTNWADVRERIWDPRERSYFEREKTYTTQSAAEKVAEKLVKELRGESDCDIVLKVWSL